MTRFLGACRALLVLLAIAAQPAAFGEGKPLTFIVGYPAGGATDVLARLYAEGVAKRLDTPVVVVNRPGASSRVAVAEVKRSAADSKVFLFTNASPLVIFPNIYADLPYDPPRDFAPVAVAARTDLVLSVGPGVPDQVRTLKDYMAWVKAHPDQASFGAVQGTSPHFAGQLFSSAAGLNLRLIPYKGGAAAVTDALGGHVPAVVTALGEAQPFKKEGGLRMLAVMSARRSSLAPETPCMAELGFASIDFPGWIGLLAPTGAPPALIEQLNSAFAEIARQPAVIAQIHGFGLEPETESPTAFKDLIAADLERYRKAVALTGFKATD